MFEIKPNTQKIYLAPNPALVLDKFVFMGRRYFLLRDHALISESNHVLPPEDRGFYLKLSKKDFKDMKKRYEENRTKFLKAVGYLNEGVQKTQTAFSF